MFDKKLAENRKFIFFALTVITFVCFYNALFMDFVWDDISHLNEFAKRIKGFSSLFNFFKTTNIVGEPLYYRPLMLISYGTDYLIYNNYPLGYHITSIVLHIANVILVFLITERLLTKRIAFLSALLFAIHPLHCEPVVWISARADVLAAFFSFLSFYYYLSFFEGRKTKHLIFTLLFFTLAIFTKEVSLMLLPVFFIFPFVKSTKISKRDLILFAVCFFIIIFYLLIREQMVGGFVIDYYPLEAKLATIPILLTSYFKLFFYPFDLHLLYAKPEILPEATLETVVSVLILIIVVLLTYLIYKKERILLFFIIFYFAFLLPVSGVITFVRISIIADRYLYLPSYGLIVLCAYVFVKIYDAFNSKQLKFALNTVLIFVIILLFVTAVKRNTVWDNQRSFLQTMIKDMPNYHGAYLQLGIQYTKEKRYKEAEKAYFLAYKYAGLGDKPRVLNNLCSLYLSEKRYDLAEKYCLEGIRLDKRHRKLFSNLADVYIALKRYDDAYNAIFAAINLERDNPTLYNTASFIALNAGRLEEALSLIDMAIELDPANEKFKANRAFLLEQLAVTQSQSTKQPKK